MQPISNKELDNMSNMLYSQYSKVETNYYIFASTSEKLINKISQIECSKLPPIEKQKEAY